MRILKSISKLNFRFIALGAALACIAVPALSSAPALAQSALYNKSGSSSGGSSESVALFNRSTGKSQKAPVFFNQKYAKYSAEANGYKGNVIGDYYQDYTKQRNAQMQEKEREEAREAIRNAVQENARKNREKYEAKKLAEAKKQMQQKKGFAAQNNYQQQNTAYAAPIVKYVYRP